MITEDFLSWLNSHQQDITHVSKFMSESLSDEPEALILDLETAEGWNSRIQFLLAEANSWLDRCSFTLMPAKENRSELERKLILDDAVSLVRKERDKIEALVDSIKTRLSLGQSILSYMRQTMAPTIQNKPKSLREILGEQNG